MSCINCICNCCKINKEVYPAYRLLKNIPGLPAGTVFLHDLNDTEKGSPAVGCIKNAWFKGNCQIQYIDGESSWCAETHVLPGQMKDDLEWFVPINNNGDYHF